MVSPIIGKQIDIYKYIKEYEKFHLGPLNYHVFWEDSLNFFFLKKKLSISLPEFSI
jgi:hypothetical protein